MGQTFSTIMATTTPQASFPKAVTASASESESDGVITIVLSKETSIYDLLHERPTNWEAVKKRAASVEKSKLPRDLIAQLFLACNPGPSIQDFEWFMVKFGASAGYHGFGVAKAEFDRDFTSRIFYQAIAKHMDHVVAGGNIFEELQSAVAAKAIIEAFGDSMAVSEAALCYIFVLVQKDSISRDNYWEYFKTIVETYGSKITEYDRWTKKGDTFLLGNVILALLEHLYGQHEVIPFFVSHLVSCLKFIKKHDPSVLLQRNDEQDTILHLILNRARQLLPSFADDEDDINIPVMRYTIVNFLVTENPEMCLIRNADGDLPIRIALDLKDDQSDKLIAVLHEAAPQVAETRCRRTGLYPFQLAAENANDRPACDCYLCSTCLRMPNGISVSSVYTLLRQSPQLITGGYSSEENKRVEMELGDEAYIAVAREELRLARKRLQLKRMNKEVANKEEEMLIKKRKLRETLPAEEDEEDEEERESDCDSSGY